VESALAAAAPMTGKIEGTRRIRAMPELSGVKIVAMTGWGKAAVPVRSLD
jgi:hypothetical protein